MTTHIVDELERLPLLSLVDLLKPISESRSWGAIKEGQSLGIIPIGQSVVESQYTPVIKVVVTQRLENARNLPPMLLDDWAALALPSSRIVVNEFTSHCLDWLGIDPGTTRLPYDVWVTHWEAFTDVPF